MTEYVLEECVTSLLEIQRPEEIKLNCEGAIKLI